MVTELVLGLALVQESGLVSVSDLGEGEERP